MGDDPVFDQVANFVVIVDDILSLLILKREQEPSTYNLSFA